jgi:molybdopterin molybdotransferase
MTPTQRLSTSLMPLERALASALDGLAPVAPVALPLAEAICCVVAELPPFDAHPPHDVAAVDGWAMRANDLVGASSYTPLPLPAAPYWVEAGDAMPDGCDCVLDADAVEVDGPLAQVLSEAFPGQGVRRKGHDIAQGRPLVGPRRRLCARDLLVARAAGIDKLLVRRPRLRIVNVPGARATADFIAASAASAGAAIEQIEARGRDTASVAGALDVDACDVLITIGGSGVGRTDAAVTALAARGAVLVHGIAMQPGRTSAVGRIGTTPVIALPGAPDHAYAAWWTLAIPVLDRLSEREPRKTLRLPLSRKIASSVGIAEFVLLERGTGAWTPLAVGDLSLAAIARAQGWLVVPGGSEGLAAGAPADAYMLRE